MASPSYARRLTPAIQARGSDLPFREYMPFRDRLRFAVDGRAQTIVDGRLLNLRDGACGANRLRYPPLGRASSAKITANRGKPTLDMRDAPAAAGGFQIPLEYILEPDAVTLMMVFYRPQLTETTHRNMFSVMKSGAEQPSISLQHLQSAYRTAVRRDLAQAALFTPRTFSNDNWHVVWCRWSWVRSVSTIWNPNAGDTPVDNIIAASTVPPPAGVVDKPTWSEADGWTASLFNRWLPGTPLDQPNRFLGQAYFAMAVDWDFDIADVTAASPSPEFLMFRDFCNAKRAEMIG